MQTILLIDDDARLANLLEDYFSRYALKLMNVTHPMQGIQLVQENKSIKLVILDIMLPDMDGFEVCRNLRKTTEIPILMLSARGDVTDRIIGLEIGADDYLAKPFEPRELVARIHCILKRHTVKETPVIVNNTILQWHDFLLNKNNQQVRVQKKNVILTTKEYELLVLFVENPHKHFNRNEIMNCIYGIDAELFSRSIDILISRLRHKLKPLECIKTVWGKGYCFVPPDEIKQ
ncbi:MAG: response regulator transcription factor [Methylococcales bacterium]|nr:response regulator transcription factor [Methylococcales bacterium]